MIEVALVTALLLKRVVVVELLFWVPGGASSTTVMPEPHQGADVRCQCQDIT